MNLSFKDFLLRLEKFNYYLLLSFSIGFFAVFLKYPLLSYKSEFFAETATNFFYHSRYSSFLAALKVPEAGYFALFQRILSEIIYFFGKFFPAYFPEFYNITALVFISLVTSMVNLKIFKSFIGSNFFRFLLSISIHFIPDFDIYTYINMIYFGFLLIFMLLFISYKTKLKEILAGILGFIIINSKGLLLSVMPYVGLKLMFAFITKQKRNIALLSLLFLGGITQSLYSLYFIFTQSTSSQSIKDFSLATLNSLWGIITIPFFAIFYWLNSIHISFLIFFIVPYFYLLYFLSYKRKKYLEIFIFLFLSSFTAAFLTFYLASFPFQIKNPDSTFSKLEENRWFFISYQSVLITYFLILDYFRKKNKLLVYYIAITITVFKILFFIQHPRFDHFPPNSPWNWKRDYPQIFQEHFTIPIVPEGWYLKR